MTDPSTPPTAPLFTDADRCRSQAAGHNLNIGIQVMRAINPRSEEERFVPCTIIAVDGDGWFTVRLTGTGEELRYWHHSPKRIATLTKRSAPWINVRWSLIARNDELSHLSSITTEPHGCVVDAPKGDLFEQLRTHGGFTVSGQEALRQVGIDPDALEQPPESAS